MAATHSGIEALVLSPHLVWGQGHPADCTHVCPGHAAHFLLVHIPDGPGAVLAGGQQVCVISQHLKQGAKLSKMHCGVAVIA